MMIIRILIESVLRSLVRKEEVYSIPILLLKVFIESSVKNFFGISLFSSAVNSRFLRL
jgi:hypothetical protein